MYSFLLKKALPFALTFVFGAALSGLLGLFGGSEQKKFEWTSSTSTYDFGSRCRMRRHNLVAITKPLQILYKPDAVLPREFHENDWHVEPIFVNVTFGADGEVQKVERVSRSFLNYKPDDLVNIADAVQKAAETAARGIRFTPEMVDGRPVTVEREVEISFASE